MLPHLFDPTLIGSDIFVGFMDERQARLFSLLEQSIEKATQTGDQFEEGIDVESDEDGVEAEQSISVS